MEELQQKLNSVSQELALFQMRELERDNELGERVKQLEEFVDQFKQSHTPLERLGDLENRIEVLEEARQRQIALNMETANKLKEIADEPKKIKEEKPILQPEPKPKTFWDLFKK